MKILVTGGTGYLGSVLIPKLLIRGHQIRVLDVGYFGVNNLRSLLKPVELIRDDIRRVINDPEFCETLLQDCDCIIHLAAISNDPSAELNPQLTEEVNFLATKVLAENAKQKNIRFLFSSSCSVYGEAEGEIHENGLLNPLTNYAISKVNSEQVLTQLADDNWRPVILRNGTLYGYSSRMRFDLVINIFSLYSTIYNEIKIFGDGQQWRPFLHLNDCARAFVYFAEKQDLKHLSYNISAQNLRVVDLAEIFQKFNPKLDVKYIQLPDVDKRNYRVSSQRMESEGFLPRINLEQGIEDMIEAIMSGLVPDPESIYYRNAKWLKELTQIGGKNHREIVNLMETLAQVRLTLR